MTTFTVDTDNNITVYKSTDEARQSEAKGVFQSDSQAALANASADWPLSRFIEIWNSIPGQSQVKKFTDRKSAVARIWFQRSKCRGRVFVRAAYSRRLRQVVDRRCRLASHVPLRHGQACFGRKQRLAKVDATARVKPLRAVNQRCPAERRE